MITPDVLDTILGDWKKRMITPHPGEVQRALILGGGLRPELATIVTGPRRAGKSTYLGQLPSRLGIPLERCWFCNFEDPDLVLHLDPRLLDSIVSLARERTPAGEMAYFFLDEIQTVPRWEKWLHKALTGVRNCVYVLTGSNASMLSGELATALTGRYRAHELFPFSWEEFSEARGSATLEDYLRLGGFPVAVTDPDPNGYLKELFRNIVLRDIAPRVGARSTVSLLQVVSTVYQSVGSELSMRRIASAVGVATDTVGQYLDACAQAYMVFPCPYFSFSERQSGHRQKKYYAVDTGLRQAVSGTAGLDRGKNLENLIFLTMRRRGLPVSYWRDEGEVDFVVLAADRIIPIQVSWEGPSERHHVALDGFYRRYPQAAEPVFIDASNAPRFVRDCEGFLRIDRDSTPPSPSPVPAS